MVKTSTRDGARDLSDSPTDHAEVKEAIDMLRVGDIFTGFILTIIIYVILVIGCLKGSWSIPLVFFFAGIASASTLKAICSSESEERDQVAILLLGFLMWPLFAFLGLQNLQERWF